MGEQINEAIKAVFFDHDDTLVNSIGTKSAQHKYIARLYYSKELTDEEIRKHWGKPLYELFRILYETDDAEMALAHTLTHHEEFPKKIFPETIPVFRRLHAAGKILGIITAHDRIGLEHDLTFHEIPRDTIDYTQTSDETSYHKPDKRVFDPAIAWLKNKGVSPHETIYVADGLHDMQAALGAGLNFLGVETGLVTGEQFRSHGVESVANIGEVYDWILRLSLS